MAARNFAVLVSQALELGDVCANPVHHSRGGLLPCLRENEIDRRSAADLMQGLEALGHRAVLIPVGEGMGAQLGRSGIEGCLLALHGPVGAGPVQTFLANLGLAYSGQPATTAALAFDKTRARQTLAYHNLPVPTAVALGPGQPLGGRTIGFLGWPCVLKPRRGAHGIGLTYLRTPGDVHEAVSRALEVDRELVLERAIHGTEIQVVLVGERVLGAMQIDRSWDEPSCEQQCCPPRLPATKMAGVANLARRAVTALGIRRGITRVDIMVSNRRNELILEVEPSPPLHRDGVVARVARANGLAYEDLVGALIGEIDQRQAGRAVDAAQASTWIAP